MFTIEVEFLRGTYEAGGERDTDPPEWPPHTARLFNALVAAADHDDAVELDALRWLEATSPPSIIASRQVIQCGGRTSFVPTNQLEMARSYGRFPARKGLGPRTWQALSPADPRVTFRWEEDPPDQFVEALCSVSARVPYLGRSTSPVAVHAHVGVAAETASTDDHRTMRVPTDGRGVAVSAPRAGYLAELHAAFTEGRAAHDVRREIVTYDFERPGSSDGETVSPYGQMIVLGFANGRRFAQGHLVTLTSRLREAIQSHVDGGPVVLRGHQRGAEVSARHQIAIVGLPDVGHDHASGRLMGMALLLPREIEAEDRALVLRGLLGVVQHGLTLGKLGDLRLDPVVQPLQSLRTGRWCRPSTTWTSATPISANRHHRRYQHDLLVSDVADSCAHLDLPVPVSVDVRRTPWLAGGEQLPPRARVRHAGDSATASYHATVEFAVPVSGPIVLGSMRRYGLGLMLPTATAGERQDV